MQAIVVGKPPATPDNLKGPKTWQPSVGYLLSPYSSQTLQKLGNCEGAKEEMRLSDSERVFTPAGHAISKIRNQELDTRQNFEGRRSGMKVNDLSTIVDPDSTERLRYSASPAIKNNCDPSKV